MTGILGFKAYRCLNNCRIIAVALGTLRVAIFTMLALDLSRLQSVRRLSSETRALRSAKRTYSHSHFCV